MIDIPDAPWVGLCKEDYYARFKLGMYDDEEDCDDEEMEDEDE